MVAGEGDTDAAPPAGNGILNHAPKRDRDNHRTGCRPCGTQTRSHLYSVALGRLLIEDLPQVEAQFREDNT